MEMPERRAAPPSPAALSRKRAVPVRPARGAGAPIPCCPAARPSASQLPHWAPTSTPPRHAPFPPRLPPGWQGAARAEGPEHEPGPVGQAGGGRTQNRRAATELVTGHRRPRAVLCAPRACEPRARLSTPLSCGRRACNLDARRGSPHQRRLSGRATAAGLRGAVSWGGVRPAQTDRRPVGGSSFHTLGHS
jgi:hypothetical protein